MSFSSTLTATAVSLLLFISAAQGGTLERCQELSQDVRVAHYYYFGVDFPYEYSVAQLQQESNCRNVISRDGVGSEGPAQITYRLWKSALVTQGISEIRTTKNHVRAQAYINKSAYNEAQHKKLWIMYQIYNGGGLVNKEVRLAGSPDWKLAYLKCRRKVVHFSDGSSENACDINYDYSQRIFKYSEKYRLFPHGKSYPFW